MASVQIRELGRSVKCDSAVGTAAMIPGTAQQACGRAAPVFANYIAKKQLDALLDHATGIDDIEHERRATKSRPVETWKLRTG